MYTISESPSRYEDLVNILPKTRYAHIESPSRHVKNEDSAQRAPPETKVFGHPQLLTRKVVYILTTRPSHIYTCFNRFDVGCEKVLTVRSPPRRGAEPRRPLGDPWGTLGEFLGDPLRGPFGGPLRDLWGILRRTLGGTVGEPLVGTLVGTLGGTLGWIFGWTLGRTLGGPLGGALWGPWGSLGEASGEPWESLGGPFWGPFRGPSGNPLEDPWVELWRDP